MFRAIQVRAEGDAFVRYFPQFAQAEYLEAAGIGENRAWPRHELVKAAHSSDQFVAGTQIEMVCVGEDYLSVEIFEILLCLAFYRGCGANRHERRRLDHAVRRGETPQARTGRIGRQNLEMKTHFEKLYQEKAAVIPTFATTYSSQVTKSEMNAFPKESFFGAAAL